MSRSEEIARENFFKFIWQEMKEELNFMSRILPSIMILGFLVSVILFAAWLGGAL